MVRPPAPITPVAGAANAISLAASVTYSLDALKVLSKKIGFEIDDNSSLGGSLWARTDAANQDVTRMLTSWGFSHKPGKGWWK